MNKQNRYDYGKRYQKKVYKDNKNPTLCDLIIEPIITEKSSIFEMNKVLTFKVEKWADKRIITAAVKMLFNCNVLKTRVVNLQQYKKAYITIDEESFNNLRNNSTIIDDTNINNATTNEEN